MHPRTLVLLSAGFSVACLASWPDSPAAQSTAAGAVTAPASMTGGTADACGLNGTTQAAAAPAPFAAAASRCLERRRCGGGSGGGTGGGGHGRRHATGGGGATGWYRRRHGLMIAGRDDQRQPAAVRVPQLRHLARHFNYAQWVTGRRFRVVPARGGLPDGRGAPRRRSPRPSIAEGYFQCEVCALLRGV
jgi:hypothetical protein